MNLQKTIRVALVQAMAAEYDARQTLGPTNPAVRKIHQAVERLRDALAVTVPCRECKAEPGASCTSPLLRSRRPHAPRMEDAGANVTVARAVAAARP
jgi:hypothetical protein